MLSLQLFWMIVACTAVNPTPIATPTNLPAPVTTPTRSDAPTSPSIMPTTVPTAAQPTSTPTRAQPSRSITATVAPSPAATLANAPRIISFTVIPTTTHTLGEKINIAWEAKGEQASLCPYIIGPQGPVEQIGDCSDVPLAGTKTMTVGEGSLGWTGLQLRVTAGQASDRSLVPLHVGCQGLRDWFFANPPDICPQAAATHSPAAAQHFQRGFMVWDKQPDMFYVFYDGGESARVFETISAPYSFKPGASPNNRVAETPPPGLFEPVSGFGQLWRGEMEGAQDVRQRLGWATDVESSFNTSYQCETANHLYRLWTCYLQGPDGKVLRLRPDSTAQAHFIWEVR